MRLIAIGFWRNKDGNILDEDGNYPDVQDYIDPTFWNENGGQEVKEKVLDYLNSFEDIESWMGFSACRLCGNLNNGSTDKSDGEFIWPEGYPHYIKEHDIVPPRRLIVKALEYKK